MKSLRLQKIDDSLIAEHSSLKLDDICLFLGEYATRKGYHYSIMNQLIFNLKKEVSRKEMPDWAYKEKAIKDTAELLMCTTHWNKLKACTWIPFPPSKTSNNQEYDDRLMKILQEIKKTEHKLDIRQLLISKLDRNASHLGGKRFTQEEHVDNLILDKQCITPKPSDVIIIFDDVIATGASFKAAQAVLKNQFTASTIAGIFIARATNR